MKNFRLLVQPVQHYSSFLGHSGDGTDRFSNPELFFPYRQVPSAFWALVSSYVKQVGCISYSSVRNDFLFALYVV